MDDNINDVVVAIIAKDFGVPVQSISLTSQFVDDLDIDSLGVIELVMQVEDEFNIEITDDEIKTIRVVEDLTKLIRDKINNLGQP